MFTVEGKIFLVLIFHYIVIITMSKLINSIITEVLALPFYCF